MSHGAGAEPPGSPSTGAYFAACRTGDVARLRPLLDETPELVSARDPDGATPLHLAVMHPAALRLLLERGADPNARDVLDRALPLHFAAGGAPLESVRMLLDAGSDPHGRGDAHALDAIGWAACFTEARPDVIALLLERGARHHVFSAVATGDHAALRRLAEEEPDALRRRLAPSEQEQTALHYCVAPADGIVGGLFRTGAHRATLRLLIELGADVEATDARGRTPLEVAMLHGDREAMRMLHGAGAREPDAEAPPEPAAADVARAVTGLVPMLAVPDVEAAVAWYRGIGFELTGSWGDGATLDWAEVRLGEAIVMFARSGDPWRAATTGLTLWLYTSRIDELRADLRRRQLERAREVLAGREPAGPDIRFRADLHTTPYGMRELAIEDPHGIVLTFAQPAD